MGLLDKEVWITKGVAMNEGGEILEGVTEWQFGDGPVGARDYSADYRNLEDGLREHSGKIMHWDPSNDGPGD